LSSDAATLIRHRAGTQVRVSKCVSKERIRQEFSSLGGKFCCSQPASLTNL